MTPDQQSDQPPGQRLHDALQHTSARFGPHRADLVTLATARGRRLRLVRRAQLGAVTALVTVAGVLGAAQLHPRPATQPPAVTPTFSASATPSIPPTYSPTHPAASSVTPLAGGPRSGPLSAQLAAFLPPGTTTRLSSTGSFVDGRVTEGPPEDGPDTGKPAAGVVLYDDGKGPAVVDVSHLDSVLDAVGCGRTLPPLCEVLASGTAVNTDKLSLANGQLMWVATATRPDGRRVRVTAVNSDQGITDSGRPTRAEPPLTTDQLQAIALSPHWDRPTQ